MLNQHLNERGCGSCGTKPKTSKPKSGGGKPMPKPKGVWGA